MPPSLLVVVPTLNSHALLLFIDGPSGPEHRRWLDQCCASNSPGASKWALGMVPRVWSTSLNDNELIPGRAAGREAGAAMESPAGSIGTGSSPGPVRWRFRAEPIRDSTVWAGYGECST